MSHFAVGDVQGCAHSLENLLEKLPCNAKLIFCGDLVNRGPRSTETLDLLMSLGKRATCLLGNHDLHFLAVAHGLRNVSKSDTLSALLDSPRLPSYVEWLRRQKLAHSLELQTELKPNGERFLFVHAGLLPIWTSQNALAMASQVERLLRGATCPNYLTNMYVNTPTRWVDARCETDQFRLAVNTLTRCRFLYEDGSLELESKEGLAHVPSGALPWFDHPARQTNEETVVFGHWSTLGYFQRDNLISLDSGCVWGGKLTAVEMETRQLVQVDYAD